MRITSLVVALITIAVLPVIGQEGVGQEIKQGAKAVAEGVREGWSRDKPLDLNAATKEQLLKLPGITPAQADRIIAGRPYDDPKDLVTRHILPQTEYDKISDRLTAKKQS